MRFSDYNSIGLSQKQLDFVNVSDKYDTPVYLDPYALELSSVEWSNQASEQIRSFFEEVLTSIRDGDRERSVHLMSHLTEPKETYLGVSAGEPQGRGVGRLQAEKMLKGIESSEAYKSGLLSDLSEMALYVEGVGRDKISDLTTNIVRNLLVDYTNEQCDLHGVEVQSYALPPYWSIEDLDWKSGYVNLPYMNGNPVILVPKFAVRRKLSLDSQEFYNHQLMDFLISEHLSANSSLVKVLKNGNRKVYKKDIKKKYPQSKSLIAKMISENPQLLEIYKTAAKQDGPMNEFSDDEKSIHTVCRELIEKLGKVPLGREGADEYHKIAMGALTAVFYPNLIQPKKEHKINDGRKRLDVIFTNSGNYGFFSQRRDEALVNANFVIVECKNYSNDIANAEFDQMLGRFSDQMGKLGIIVCRSIDDEDLMLSRCKDASRRNQGRVIVLTDENLKYMLDAKSKFEDDLIEALMFDKYRDIIS